MKYEIWTLHETGATVRVCETDDAHEALKLIEQNERERPVWLKINRSK